MQLQEGVDLHFIETDQFTTNQIRVRFAAPLSAQTIAGRVLVANLLELANQIFPTPQLFRKELARLYGAQLSTSVLIRGQVHYVDVTIRYASGQYLPHHTDVTKELLHLLHASLFQPLVQKSSFDEHLFAIEKKNLLAYLESEKEDHAYHADVELGKLFFQDEDKRIPRVARLDLVEKETPQTTYKALQNMLALDKIDFFFLGRINEEEVVQIMKSFPFTYRKPKLSYSYQQDFSRIMREKIERREARQSILHLAYHLQVVYNDVNYAPLMVFNGLLGGFAHSKLFQQVREKEGLAYTIGSSVAIFSSLLKIYAGIDKKDRSRAVKLIHQQLLDMKLGRFTDEELDLTKSMLIHSVRLAQDRQGNLIEQAYNQHLLGVEALSWQDWIAAVKQVSREDVMRVAQLIRLQAVYFMEGKGE